MRQTLLFIPHELAGIPVFGVGWLLGIAIVLGVATLGYLVRRQGWNSETRGMLPFFAIIAAIVVFLLPHVEVNIQGHERAFMAWQYPLQDNQTATGLPIRGYGVFLLLATVSGVLLARYRALQVGFSPDAIYNLAFSMFVGGILGARAFYIIQYWSEIRDPASLVQTLKNMVNFVEGGLVVYGSLIGALLAAVLFLKRNRIPILPVADLIAPSLALGLAIGRVGCLMNGCCFGGVCDHNWAIVFPEQSPAYYHQQSHGSFHGFSVGVNDAKQPIVDAVTVGGSAEKAGLNPGTKIESIGNTVTDTLETALYAIASSRESLVLKTSTEEYRLQIPALPDKALPVHPTQIYSSVNAGILAISAFAIFPFRRRDGEVFGVLIFGYAVTRFLLEVIRTDEGSFSETGLTISQNVSIGMLIGVAVLAIYLWQRPPGTFWPSPKSTVV